MRHAGRRGAGPGPQAGAPAEVADAANGLKGEALDGLKGAECPPADAVQPEPQKPPAPEGPTAPPASGPRLGALWLASRSVERSRGWPRP
ncbi:hypothetical protein [Nannocystis pusilla]|uniref:hypothetical protein n=1 Tax=Nannocystis pusilla TaxID=889268 RepID=UPI003B804029